jgi:hypothetical protein
MLAAQAGLAIQKPAAGSKNVLDETVFTWHETCVSLSYNRCSARSNGSLVEGAVPKPPFAGKELEHSRMTIFDLIKATVVCGLIAFLIYSYPVLGQIVLIGFLSLLWLAYAHKTIANLRRR